MISRLSTAFGLIPFKTMLVVVFLCYVKVGVPAPGLSLDPTAEFYPFSSFPMFSTFADSARYVHLADGDGEAVLPGTFNSSTGSLSKSYRKYLIKQKNESGRKFDDLPIAQRRAAGDLLLRDLRDSVAPLAFEEAANRHLRLYEIVLRRDAEGRLVRERSLVGEYVEPVAAAGGVNVEP